MSVIFALKKFDGSGDEVPGEKQKPYGMQALGDAIKDRTGDRLVNTPPEYANGLALAINHVIRGAGGQGTFEVYYQQRSVVDPEKISEASAAGPVVTCTMDQGGPEVQIHVQIDNPGQARHMFAVFPRVLDGADEKRNYLYISDTARDILELPQDAGQIGEYLIAFKFLGRCN